MRGRGRAGPGPCPTVPPNGQGATSGRQHPRYPGPPRRGPPVHHDGGRYVDDLRINGDIPFTGAAVAHYVRSAVAHGTITAIDTDEARAMPGVIAVFTAADLDLEPVPARFNPTVARPLLAADRVRFVGEPVAVIVADHRGSGCRRRRRGDRRLRRARRLHRPARRDRRRRLLFDAVDGNVVLDSTAMGMPGLTAATTSSPTARSSSPATSSTSGWRRAPRGRSAAAAWVDGRLHVWMSTQHAQGARDLIAQVNGLDAGGPRHHARRRRRVRRQDHAVPRGAAARPPGQGARPAGGLGGDAQRVDDESRPRPCPDPRRHDRRHAGRPGHPLPARRPPGLRRLGRGRRRAPGA